MLAASKYQNTIAKLKIIGRNMKQPFKHPKWTHVAKLRIVQQNAIRQCFEAPHKSGSLRFVTDKRAGTFIICDGCTMTSTHIFYQNIVLLNSSCLDFSNFKLQTLIFLSSQSGEQFTKTIFRFLNTWKKKMQPFQTNMVSEQLLGAAKIRFSHIEIRTILRCREARGPAWYAGIRILFALCRQLFASICCAGMSIFSVFGRAAIDVMSRSLGTAIYLEFNVFAATRKTWMYV